MLKNKQAQVGVLSLDLRNFEAVSTGSDTWNMSGKKRQRGDSTKGPKYPRKRQNKAIFWDAIYKRGALLFAQCWEILQHCLTLLTLTLANDIHAIVAYKVGRCFKNKSNNQFATVPIFQDWRIILSKPFQSQA